MMCCPFFVIQNQNRQTVVTGGCCRLHGVLSALMRMVVSLGRTSRARGPPSDSWLVDAVVEYFLGCSCGRYWVVLAVRGAAREWRCDLAVRTKAVGAITVELGEAMAVEWCCRWISAEGEAWASLEIGEGCIRGEYGAVVAVQTWQLVIVDGDRAAVLWRASDRFRNPSFFHSIWIWFPSFSTCKFKDCYCTYLFLWLFWNLRLIKILNYCRVWKYHRRCWFVVPMSSYFWSSATANKKKKKLYMLISIC